jgi:hypothetical protein
MVIQVLETVTKEEEKKREGLGSMQPSFSSVWHIGLSGGAPDSVRCARLVRGELAALGIRRRHTAIIHRTVRWCTGLSGEPTVGREICGRRVAAPTVGGGHRTVSDAPTDPELQRSSVPDLEGDRAPDECYLAEPRDKHRVSLVLLLSVIICVRKSSPHRLD